MNEAINSPVLFWIFSLLFLVIALAFLLPPLLRKPTDVIDDRREQNISITKSQLAELETEFKTGGLEEETYLQAKDELEETLYSDLDEVENSRNLDTSQRNSKFTAIFVALLVPVLATALYFKYGTINAIAESSVVRGAPSSNNPNASSKPQLSLEEIVVKLENKLKSEPNDLKGWSMLGRTYMVMKRPADAVTAYTRALGLNPGDPTTLLQLADALATSKDGNLLGKPEEYIHQALQKEPENLMGLWLAGMSAKQRGSSEEAISYWNKVLPKLAPGSSEVKEVQGLILEAGGKVDAGSDVPTDKLKSATSATTATTGSASSTADDASKNGIAVKIDLANELKSKANPDHTVFIYAKAVTGPPMPLAAVRKQVKDLPFEVVLDDSMAMMPQLKISGFKQVTVGARVSVGGTPTKNSGDLFTEQSPVALGKSITLIIDTVVE